MSELLDMCLRDTGRSYPPGYGFALAYLRADFSPAHFKALRDAALWATPRQASRGNPDATAFIKAYQEAHSYVPPRGWGWWLIEAAQLVLAEALREGSRGGRCSKALALCGHPGY